MGSSPHPPGAPGEVLPAVFAPARLGPLTLKNRIIKAATFEGAAPEGEVTERLVEFHRRMASGGVAMSTVAYLAVSPEGRTDRHCVLLGTTLPLRDCDGSPRPSTPPVRPPRPRSAMPGRWPTPAPTAPLRWPRRGGSTPAGRVTRAVSEADIARITERLPPGAEVAVEAGFDCLEIHLGHNYLLSAFLSPKLNRRSDRWGGSLVNRARFPRQVVEAVSEAVGDGVAVTAKLNMADGVTGGFWLEESIAFGRMLEAEGALDALELTGGSSLSNPMYLFRGEAPRREFAATLPGPLRARVPAGGLKFLQAYPFEEAYFLPYARQFLDALDLPLILLGGINRLDTVEAALAEGFSFVAMARALLREPDLVGRWERGADQRTAYASTATSACPPSTAAPAACWWPARVPAQNRLSTRGMELVRAASQRRRQNGVVPPGFLACYPISPSSSSRSPGTSGASRSQPSDSASSEPGWVANPPMPSGSSMPPSRVAMDSGSSRSTPASSSSRSSTCRVGSSRGSRSTARGFRIQLTLVIQRLVPLLERIGSRWFVR